MNIKNDEYGYSVELRHRTECGDYTEDHFDFDTKEDAIEFAKKEELDIPGSVHSILDYQSVGRNYDPIDITNEVVSYNCLRETKPPGRINIFLDNKTK